MENKEKKLNTIPKCKQFNCDKMHVNYCCFYCSDKMRCKNRCLNHPGKCKLFVAAETKKEVKYDSK